MQHTRDVLKTCKRQVSSLAEILFGEFPLAFAIGIPVASAASPAFFPDREPTCSPDKGKRGMLGQPASEGLLVSSREPPLRFSATLQLILLRVFAPDERMRCRSGHTCPSFPLGISPPVTHMQEYSTHSAGKESVGSLALILSQELSTYGFLHSLDIGGEVPPL